MGAALSAIGCVRTPQVESKQLPVERVVVYRNGVAYFERRGEVKSERVHFQLREENVGDFLATLAVLEKGGHTVRAASFPVKMDEGDTDPVDPAMRAALDSWEGKKKDPRKLRRVTLELDGQKHDLSVGYLAETPLWRPSYRLVVGTKGKATFQAWGIVQNQSGEDWENVEIALVAGAPIAFESTLGEPVIPRRPVVTDQGEVISAVPEGSTTLHEAQVDESAPMEPMMEAEEAMADTDDSYGYSMKRDSLMGAGAGRSQATSKPAPPPAAPRPALSLDNVADGSAAPRDTSRLSRVEIQTGATRYEVPHRVTIPDQSATMVLLISKDVPGEAVYLFDPNGAVGDSYSHPFRVAIFKNETGGALERGPIAVFEKGAFIGQGLVDALPIKGEATVPFALIRSLSIKKEITYDQRGGRLYAVREGQLTIERDQATLTEYKVQNGDQEAARVLLRHPRSPGSKLWEPPKGTKELSGRDAADVPISVPAFGKASLLVEERLPHRQIVDWQSAEARTSIRAFLKTNVPTPGQRAALEEILKYASELSSLEDKERGLTREQRELEKSTRETRLSIEAIEKNQAAAKLRAELTARLGKGTARLEVITRDLIELALRRTEAEVRLKEARQGLIIEPQDQK